MIGFPRGDSWEYISNHFLLRFFQQIYHIRVPEWWKYLQSLYTWIVLAKFPDTFHWKLLVVVSIRGPWNHGLWNNPTYSGWDFIPYKTFKNNQGGRFFSSKYLKYLGWNEFYKNVTKKKLPLRKKKLGISMLPPAGSFPTQWVNNIQKCFQQGHLAWQHEPMCLKWLNMYINQYKVSI